MVELKIIIRRSIIKRPFLATLERLIDPLKADIFITSAFHPPYVEKMLKVSEAAHYPAIIIVRNGIEGSIAFGLNRTTKLLCSIRRDDGTYTHEEMRLDPKELLGVEIKQEEKLENIILEDNINLIKQFASDGKTGYDLFDLRVKATCKGLKHAIQWIIRGGVQ